MTPARTRDLDPDIRLLAALADPARLAIVRQLAADSETCACDLTDCCDVAQPTVSHHLKKLVDAGLLDREAGIVTSERRGQNIFYRLDPDAALRLGAIVGSLLPGGLVPAADLVARRRATGTTGITARSDA